MYEKRSRYYSGGIIQLSVTEYCYQGFIYRPGGRGGGGQHPPFKVVKFVFLLVSIQTILHPRQTSHMKPWLTTN